MRPASLPEERVVKALREATAITGPERDAAMAALEATETCDKCGGDGNSMPEGAAPGCEKCDGTGQMRVIR